jgi:hypothetical protein
MVVRKIQSNEIDIKTLESWCPGFMLSRFWLTCLATRTGEQPHQAPLFGSLFGVAIEDSYALVGFTIGSNDRHPAFIVAHFDNRRRVRLLTVGQERSKAITGL